MLRYVSFVCIVAACAMLLGCTVWSPRAVTWRNATGGEQLEWLWWQSVKEKDWTAVESHLAPTFAGIFGDQRLDKAQTLEYLKQLEVKDYSLGDVSIEPNGNTIVVTYSATMHGTRGGQTFTLSRARMMTAWQQQKRGWVEIAHAEPAL